MDSPFRIGLLGLDTSHAPAFTGLLNDPDNAHHVAGAKVVAAWPGGTAGWDKSESRVGGFTQQLRDDYGIAILESPAAVADKSDVLFITAVDGRIHRQLFEQVAAYGKPIFIDKPFATSVADAQFMIQTAKQNNILLMSSSALRFARPLPSILADNTKGAIQGIDAFGPMELDAVLPGLFWYGCHTVEMIVAAMGVGCESISAVVTDAVDVLTMRWSGGRLATLRGLRGSHSQFGATIHRENGVDVVDIAGDIPYYVGLLEAIVGSIQQNKPCVAHNQMLEVVRIMEYGNAARQAGGLVTLPPMIHGDEGGSPTNVAAARSSH